MVASRPAKRTKVAAPPSPAASDVESDESAFDEAASDVSSDDDDTGSDDASEDEAASKAEKLRALEAHGMSMFGGALPSPAELTRGAKGKGREAPVDLGLELSDENDDGEDDNQSFDEDDSEGGMEDDEARFSGGEDGDDGLATPVASSSTVSGARKPVEITFDPSRYQGGSKATKAEYKAFMVCSNKLLEHYKG